MPLSRLGKQIAEVASALNAIGVPFALIGGLALASHKVIRATQDVDLLADVEKADEIDAALAKLGYSCLHRNADADAANYARGDERIDFLFASRPIARRLLDAATGGIDAPPRVEEDPYRALDDLMAAVEALCPVWPSRDTLRVGEKMLL